MCVLKRQSACEPDHCILKRHGSEVHFTPLLMKDLLTHVLTPRWPFLLPLARIFFLVSKRFMAFH